MRIRHDFFITIFFLALCSSSSVIAEEEIDTDWRKQINAPYTDKGADRCLKCHDEDNEYPVMPLFNNKHGQFANPNSPMSGKQCESCHGPGGLHIKRPKRGEKRAPIMNFGNKSSAPAAEQNKKCLQCHQTYARIGWQGSPHEKNGLACANCHTIHVKKDYVFDKRSQVKICYRCHKKQRSEFLKPYVHPVRFGLLSCTDCHNTHDSLADNLLNTPSVNETCFQCHAEKRGPYVWEHAPAAENCALCHKAHGSNHPALLKRRPPLLCQQCHMQRNNHANVLYNDAGLPDGSVKDRGNFMLAKGCLNCHSRVHGSNHPSGVKLMR